MLDLKANAKSDQDYIKECIAPYLLALSLEMIVATKQHTISAPMREAIMKDAARPLKDLTKPKRQRITKQLHKCAESAIKNAQGADSLLEVCTGICLLILDRVANYKITDTNSQYVYWSVCIAEEAADQGGWGSLSNSKKVSYSILSYLTEKDYI